MSPEILLLLLADEDRGLDGPRNPSRPRVWPHLLSRLLSRRYQGHLEERYPNPVQRTRSDFPKTLGRKQLGSLQSREGAVTFMESVHCPSGLVREE